MAVHVVTIARTTGGRADQVGRLVAEHLGFQYISDEIIGRAAQHAGVSPRDVAEVEHSQSLIRRIITATGLVALPELGIQHRTGGSSRRSSARLPRRAVS